MSGPFAEQTPDHTAAAAARGLGAYPLLTAAEHAIHDYEQTAHDLARRILRGQRVTARHLVSGLRAQTLSVWWRMIARHGREEVLDPAHVLTRYASWISGYLLGDVAAPALSIGEVIADPALAEEDLALMHIDCGFALVLSSAAREFLARASGFSPAGLAEGLPPDAEDPADRRGRDGSQPPTAGLTSDVEAGQQ
ncbi:hypothetical protein Acor_40920 [Acrocarpospora corrugata]|uniref:Uncharacterized protein n=1 Tax=Acrocarpospora corrugata TaxID=35763 RepID=A0A5M3VYS7_9ACTN|nr:hypothetical protein [Acrocarpospora corrugata]GES02027.1 hypothetical protein Acor_40920 [Acrocarpospora corrugata]